MFVCMCFRIYVCIIVCRFVSLCMNLLVYMIIYSYVCCMQEYMHVHVCVYVLVCVHTYTNVCMYVCLRIAVCVESWTTKSVSMYLHLAFIISTSQTQTTICFICQSANPTMFEKVAARFSQWKRDGDTEAGAEESCVLEVSMNLTKHPPPQLPPTPSDLSSLQVRLFNF